MSKKSCLIIAGEKSGEDHAMTFLPELMRNTPDVEYFGVGGTRLEKEGVKLRYRLNEFSGIGISEVLSKVPFYYKALGEIVDDVKKRDTKTAILIDFQGFNLKLAKKLKKENVKVLYYVAPQAWVWKPWRAKVLEKNVHTLFTILPFEKNWFQQKGVSKVRAVIHPLMIEYGSRIKQLSSPKSLDWQKRNPRILLLPGSRNTEVQGLLPIFIKAVKLIKESFDIDVGMVKTESVHEDLYKYDFSFENSWNSNELADALEWADMAIAASGTVTLATGLFQVPTVVCYKVSAFTEAVLSLLVPYNGPISLTNIIHGEMIFPELTQYHADRYNIAKYIKAWIKEPKSFDNLILDLKELSTKLTGDEFNVAAYMAEVINAKE